MSLSAAPERQATLTVQMSEQIRSDILSCRLQPNARLRLEEMRERYRVGASPLREALMRLEAEGLVVLEQNKGFRVAPVSRAHMLDLSTTRIEIEGLALKQSIEAGGIAWEADLLGAFHRLSKQKKHERGSSGQISEGWQTEHRAFHFALVSACKSPMLLSIRDALFDQGERYVALSIARKGQTRDDVSEHEGIMRAALDRKVPKALDLLRRHFERTTEKVLATIAEQEA